MMVITKDEFEQKKISPDLQRTGKNQAKILRLLRQDTSKAYSQMEIQQMLDVKHVSAINYALHALRKKGLVQGKIVGGIMYWRAQNGEEGVSKVLSNHSGNSENGTPDQQDAASETDCKEMQG